MRIEKLFLSAFGPFTDRELDFAATPANFHLIYGPNEAGKSSALRAMGDLRFGIHPRSTDDFIHEYSRILLGGVFANTAGERVALARRKGNKQTLLYADPGNGKPIDSTAVASAVEHALTGGLDRKQFEVMFGIDHERLREGGKLLLSADGELGSALFEASAGTRGVTALLASLQEDSRRYFIPRSKLATLNEASLQIDEYKRAFRQALTRPAEWKDRQRAHADAKTKLAELRDQLFKLRRRENELTELRAVQPLLKQYDDTLAALNGLMEVPLLPADARENRLAAEQSLQTARKTISQVDVELVEYGQEKAQLMIEPALLRHAAAVERLIKDRDAASYTHVELRKTQAEADSGQLALAAMTVKIAGDRAIDDVLAAIPSLANRVMLNEHLARCNDMEVRLSSRHERVTDIQKKLQQQPEGNRPMMDAVLKRAVEEAVHTARAMGDFTKRHEKLQGEIEDHARRVRQGLTDLGLSTVEQLQGSQLLLATEITSAEKEFNRLETEINSLHKEERDLKRDLKAQQQRQHELAAAGEVVTAQTLRAARVHRDHGWDLIRKVFIQRSENPESLAAQFDPDRPLPEAFENSQSEADRQADLLREGAERATKVAECETRVAEMEARLKEIIFLKQTNALAQEQAQLAWFARLSAASLPAHQPAALREWLNLRGTVLELIRQQAKVSDEQFRLLAEAEQAASTLGIALSAVGEAVQADVHNLGTMIARASDWVQTMTKAAADEAARRNTIKSLENDLNAANQDIKECGDALSVYMDKLAGWHTRLFLAGDSSPEAIKARLDELDALQKAKVTQDGRLSRIHDLVAIQNALFDQANRLAALLGEPECSHVNDFVDRLQDRLTKSRSAKIKNDGLDRHVEAAQRKKREAEAEQSVSEAALLALCHIAGEADVNSLSHVEEQSAKKRLLQEKAESLIGQLREASTSELPKLREALSGLDTAETDIEREQCRVSIKQLEEQVNAAADAEQMARRSLDEIDTSDHAAEARERMESAIARYCAGVKPWAQLKLAESLLHEALRRFRDKAQAPMVTLASEYFRLVTSGRYRRLIVDDSAEQPALQAERDDGRHIGVSAMSEGTADQLYLALRLAALELQRNEQRQMPLILDDVLITSDDHRAANVFSALARFAEGGQVMLFTHHRHLIDIASELLPTDVLAIHSL
ncbi:YhaN family protein [Nitrosospira sp. Nsp1]|uniref:YhaN family protein n=1 Tax=Nitrosospira sp. Nsp1 TaxID=136547 RepID=UPI000886CA1C|nr:YhaN family protein [Nitrosospira sp. Nsp1]SCX39968.1 Uncharacterized protein YhaN [Nitrosospira sp. Nsp1]